MTPNNIVNMAALKGLDAIAITDHNSAGNVRACVECGAKAGIVVIPGMEVETSEDVHVVCLFPSVQQAEMMDSIVSENLPVIKNRADIFGNQYILNEDDTVVGCVDNLLSTATTLDIYTLVDKVNEIGGIAIPAHIDKSSYSVISNLGFIPEDIDFTAVEIKNPDRVSELKKNHAIDSCHIMHNSDAHFLWDIHERDFFLEVNEISPNSLVRYFKQFKQM